MNNTKRSLSDYEEKLIKKMRLPKEAEKIVRVEWADEKEEYENNKIIIFLFYFILPFVIAILISASLTSNAILLYIEDGAIITVWIVVFIYLIIIAQEFGPILQEEKSIFGHDAMKIWKKSSISKKIYFFIVNIGLVTALIFSENIITAVTYVLCRLIFLYYRRAVRYKVAVTFEKEIWEKPPSQIDLKKLRPTTKKLKERFETMSKKGE